MGLTSKSIEETTVEKTYDVLDGIMKYEGGEMERDEAVVFFQHLIDTGMAWTLRGHYGRTAAALIQSGECTTEAFYKKMGVALDTLSQEVV